MASFRKTGPCANCSHWRDPSSDMLAGTAVQEGQCRRRVQTGEDGLRPRQPVTGPGVECSEQLPLPAPERLAACCGDCRYWKAPDVARVNEGDEGFCRVWAPRWSAKRGYTFPITERGFQCGDGVSASYVDPEDEEIE